MRTNKAARRGLQLMVEADSYCIDILTQVAAAAKAPRGRRFRLSRHHLRHCLTDTATKMLRPTRGPASTQG